MTGTALAIAAGRAIGTVPRVLLADQDVTLDGRTGETLLDILERHGYHPEFSCRSGACGTCRLRILAGRVSQPADGPLSPQERATGYILSCVARPVGEVTVESAGDAQDGAVAAGGRGGPARRATRTALRWTVAAASLALFVKSWTVTSQFSLGQAGTGSALQPSVTPALSVPCYRVGDDDDAPLVCPTATPSGPSNISTHPAAPTPTPNTHSGSSR